MKKLASAIAIAAVIGVTPPATAAQSTTDEAAELARQGIEKLMQALELMIKHIPQYEAPEMNENGDIIIRRKNPPGKTAPAQPEPEGKGERNI